MKSGAGKRAVKFQSLQKIPMALLFQHGFSINY
jgi:hypothetical protein